MKHCFCQSASAVMLWFQASVFLQIMGLFANSRPKLRVLCTRQIFIHCLEDGLCLPVDLQLTFTVRTWDQEFGCIGVSLCAYPHSLETQVGGSESHHEDKEEIMASSSGSNSCKRPCSAGKRCPEIPFHKLRRVLTSLKREEDPPLSINFNMNLFFFL